MPTPLEDAKSRVSRALLGRDGVHGVGLRRGSRSIVLHVSEIDEAGRRRLLAKATPLAGSFAVEIETTPPPRASGPTG